jgi:hypothetical protein
MAMFFGSVVAIIGTALCTGAINGKSFASYLSYLGLVLIKSSWNVHCRKIASRYWRSGRGSYRTGRLR